MQYSFELEQKRTILLQGDPYEEVSYYPHAIKEDYFELLKHEIPWEEREITIYGKTHPVPRLSAWFGPYDYTYSSITMRAQEFSLTLKIIKESIEKITGETFNSVLCNYYRDGNDYVAWHADNEDELGKNPSIASVSFGASRIFSLRQRQTKKLLKIELENQSLLVMKGAVQHNWLHQLNKSKRALGPRINLTFRSIHPSI